MNGIFKQTLVLAFIIFITTGCAIFKGEVVQKIALLAPFEGRYREIGYDALYAARLALSESGTKAIDLLAIDDGGSLETAIERANAIRQDESIQAVIVLGRYASNEAVQAALGDSPMLIVGNWGAQVTSANGFILSNAEIPNRITWQGELTAIPSDEPIIGGEILALYQVPLLYTDIDNLSILSSSMLPDEAFRDAYLNSGLYVPEPNLLATLTYDATGLVIESIINQTPIAAMHYEGFNGLIHFENGFWVDAPIFHYGYDATGRLFLLP